MFAIRSDGSFRAVTPDMELVDGETRYDVLPQWVEDILANWRANNI